MRTPSKDKKVQAMKFAVGQRIKEIRIHAGDTQVEMAKATGFHYLAYRRIELGERSINLIEAKRIADALGVRIDDLIPEEVE